MTFPVDNMIFSSLFKTAFQHADTFWYQINMGAVLCVWGTVRSKKNVAILIKGQTLLWGKKIQLIPSGE